MGHDITAYRADVNREAMGKSFRIDDFDDEWCSRYDLYRSEVEVAYNRRSAGNPLNQVLYLALGVMDVYAGCSGDGSTLEITREQLETAEEVLSRKRFIGMKREPNAVDVLVSRLEKQNFYIQCGTGVQDWDISQEKEFVRKCLEYLKETGRDSVEVCFG